MVIKIYNPDTNEVVSIAIELPFSGYGVRAYKQGDLFFLEANNDCIKHVDYHVLERYSEIIALSLQRKNRVPKPRPVYHRPPKETHQPLPDCGFKLRPGCRILTVEVDLYRQRQSNVPKPNHAPEYFTYELLAGQLQNDKQNNLVVAYADEPFYFVDVYQYKKRILSEPCDSEEEAIRLFDALVTAATMVLYGIGKRSRSGQVYYEIDWKHLPVYGSLFRGQDATPKPVPQKEEIDREAYYRRKLGML
jgi:hypothetical protein